MSSSRNMTAPCGKTDDRANVINLYRKYHFTVIKTKNCELLFSVLNQCEPLN